MANAPPNASTGSQISQFFTSHRRALLITAAAITLSTAGVLYYNSTVSPPPPSSGSGSSKKKSKKSKKSTTGGSNEEITGTEAGEKDATTQEKKDDDDPLNLTSTDISLMTPSARSKAALTLKARGNKLYSSKQYLQAVQLYSKAIECEEQAVFYSNRAACYTNLNELEKVVRDCSEALRLDPSYIKALNRRATAREQIGGVENLYLALCDFTAAAIIDNFTTQATTDSVERVMKQLATEKAAQILEKREPQLPSATFIEAYLQAFRPQPAPQLPSNPTTGDETYLLAHEALTAKSFAHAFSMYHESIVQGISSPQHRAQAYNMRATFKFIMSNAQGALEDLEESTRIDERNGQSWVKKASVHMELGKPEEAMKDFEKALQVDQKNPDVYYHRGQVYFITGEFSKAMSEYKQSTSLDPSFIFSQIQLAVALYKSGETEKAMHGFRKLIRENQESPEVYNYYGELLLDQGKFDEAVKNFDKSIELAKNTHPRNVLPMVNKALALFQSTQDFATAEKICREAIEIDPQCDVGVATLAQLLLQQNKVHEAVDMFERSAGMARTEQELVNALTYENATRAQLAFLRDYPTHSEKLGLNRTN
ncbi:uncharacterized protein JCM6883_002394 [Sporobolomyces salmoneus]|uniref:uncharacterized protein n=1 Tax=Sporobolomyces salmoneus TaxID=183962 RepID=UPI00316CA4AA